MNPRRAYLYVRSWAPAIGASSALSFTAASPWIFDYTPWWLVIAGPVGVAVAATVFAILWDAMSHKPPAP